MLKWLENRFFNHFFRFIIMNLTISVRKKDQIQFEDDFIQNPEISLDLVERLRIEAGKFLYEYPTTFRRIVKVIRKKQS